MINMKLSKTQIHKVPKSEMLECTSEQNIKGITLLTSSEDANSVGYDLFHSSSSYGQDQRQVFINVPNYLLSRFSLSVRSELRNDEEP